MPVSASVVVPVRDGAATLPACLRSVLDQDVDDFEVIVVDDASTDDTPAVIADLAAADPRIRPIRLADNAGPGGARNAGIRKAQAPVLLFTDADCIVDRSWVRLHRLAQREASIVGGSVVGVHATAFGRADGYCSWFASSPGLPKQVRRAEHLPTANLGVARTVFERIGLFREGEPLYSEDAELCARVRRAGEPLLFDPAIVVRHRDRDGGRAYLRHQWVAGIQMLNYRREPGAGYRWLMPRGPVTGALLAVPVAAAYTAYVAAQWLAVDRRVLRYVPLIFAGKLAQTIAMAAHARGASRVSPEPPVLPAAPGLPSLGRAARNAAV